MDRSLSYSRDRTDRLLVVRETENVVGGSVQDTSIVEGRRVNEPNTKFSR